MNAVFAIICVLALTCSAVETSYAQALMQHGALTPGERQTQRLAPNSIHLWTMPLEAGRYVAVDVAQQEIDVVLRVLDPGDEPRGLFDTPTGPNVTQQARWIADRDGAWQLQLMSLDSLAAGTIDITWQVHREATRADREVAALDSLYARLGIHYSTDDFAGAEALLDHMLDVTVQVLGPDHPEVAGVLNARAVLLLHLGRYDEAEAALEHARTIQEQAMGPEHPDVATTLNNLSQLHLDQGRYDEAAALLQRALALQEQAFGGTHPTVAAPLENLASVYQHQGRYDEAEPLYERALAVWTDAYGPDDLHVATLLSNLAYLYQAQGRYDEAEHALQRTRALREGALGPVHSDVAAVLNSLASLYQDLGRYDEAEPLYERALAIWTRTYGPEHRDVAITLNNLAHIRQVQGDYPGADSLYRRALRIREQVLGPEHPHVANILNNLASVRQEQGDYPDADSLFQRALALQLQGLPPGHPLIASTLNNLALLYQERGRYGDAQRALQRALTLRANALGPAHPDVAMDYNNLATLYLEQGRYLEADSLYRYALALQEHALGPEHPDVATTLNNLALLYHEQGRYVSVEDFYRRALEIAQRTYSPDHPQVSITLGNLALLLMEQGRYREAEPMLRRALTIDSQRLGPTHRRVGIGYVNLGGLYQRQGRYADAEQAFEHGRDVLERVFGLEHPEAIAALDNLAGLYTDQHRYDEAEALLERVHTLRLRILGPAHPDVAKALNDLAVVYQYQNHPERAEPLFKEALVLQAQAGARTSLAYVAGLNNLAALYTSEGRYAAADTLLHQAMTLFEEALGAGHPAQVMTLIGLAENHEAAGRVQDALETLDRALTLLDDVPGYEPAWHIQAYELRARLHKQAGRRDAAIRDLEDALRLTEGLRPQVGGGEQTRARFFETYARSFDDLVAWHLEAGDVPRAFDYAERSRARVLLDQLAAGKIDLRDDIPVDVRDRLERQEARARAGLAEYQQRLTLAYAHTDYRDREQLRVIAALEDSLEQAEQTYRQAYRAVKNASPLWRDYLTTGGQPVTMAEAQRRLVPQEGLLLIYQVGATNSYLFALPPAGAPAMTFALNVTEEQADLLDAAAGALTTNTLRRSLGLNDEAGTPGLLQRRAAPDDPGYRATSHALWKTLVPEALRTRLAEAEEVVLVPDDVLHFVPFEALVMAPGTDDRETRYWLDAGPVVRYAPSVTVLHNLLRGTRSASPAPSGATVLSLSDPVFDPRAVVATTPESLLASPEAPADHAAALLPPARNRYARRGGTFAPLPGTARETRALTAALGAEAVRQMEILQGSDATEANLRSALPGKRYVHLATHGWVDGQRGALFASLVLAPPPALTADLANDGFLQLHEIYDLPLRAVEMAVLSACKSNVGPNVEGEGVFALSRGFLAAGARRVIASQWSVDDASTAALIGAFFEAVADDERAGRPVDYAGALRDAKRSVRSQAAWSPPFFWAPFILTGIP